MEDTKSLDDLERDLRSGMAFSSIALSQTADSISGLRAEIARLTAALAAAEARSVALVAAAYEAAAKWVESHRTQSVSAMATPEPCDKGYTHEGTKYAVQLRALTPADATAALARLIAEAEARGMREAAGIADGHAAPLRGKASKCRDRGDDLGEAVFDSALFEANSIATAILAAAAAKEPKP